MPVARTRTSTSPDRTTGTGASSKNNCSGPPRPWVLTAFTGIPPSLLFSRAADAMHFGKVAQRRLVRIVGHPDGGRVRRSAANSLRIARDPTRAGGPDAPINEMPTNRQLGFVNDSAFYRVEAMAPSE